MGYIYESGSCRVGLSEDEAKKRGIACEVTRYDLKDLDRAIADEAGHGFVKVLSVPGKDCILGVTIVGEHASDLRRLAASLTTQHFSGSRIMLAAWLNSVIADRFSNRRRMNLPLLI